MVLYVSVMAWSSLPAMRTITTLLAVLVAVLTASSTAPAQGDMGGKVTLESTSVAIGVGVSWGDGTLEYRGQKYAFTLRGLSVVDLGVAKVTARGVVDKLKKVEDFEGNYVVATAGAAVGGGAGAAALVNQNGVEMALTATGEGIKFSLGQGGVDIKLKK